MMSITLSTSIRIGSGMRLTSGLSARSISAPDSTLGRPTLGVVCRIRRRGADAELEEAAADIGGRLDEAVAVLVGIAHVDEQHRLAGVQAPLQLRRALFRDDLPGLGQHLLQRLHHWLLRVCSVRSTASYYHIPGRKMGKLIRPSWPQAQDCYNRPRNERVNP